MMGKTIIESDIEYFVVVVVFGDGVVVGGVEVGGLSRKSAADCSRSDPSLAGGQLP